MLNLSVFNAFIWKGIEKYSKFAYVLTTATNYSPTPQINLFTIKNDSIK